MGGSPAVTLRPLGPWAFNTFRHEDDSDDLGAAKSSGNHGFIMGLIRRIVAIYLVKTCTQHMIIIKVSNFSR